MVPRRRTAIVGCFFASVDRNPSITTEIRGSDSNMKRRRLN